MIPATYSVQGTDRPAAAAAATNSHQFGPEVAVAIAVAVAVAGASVGVMCNAFCFLPCGERRDHERKCAFATAAAWRLWLHCTGWPARPVCLETNFHNARHGQNPKDVTFCRF